MIKLKRVSKDAKEEAPKYQNLREIMDYNKPFSIFFSGVENETYFKGCYDMGVRHFLMSYHYLQKSKIPMQKRYGGLGIKFFIDSGAHTYQNDPKYQEVGLDYWEDYIKRYLSWAERNKEFIFAIANCDFENLVGSEKVKEWNEKYFEPFMLRTGIPVCFVWHQNSTKTWEQYCQRYPYLGFSSVNTEGEVINLQEYINILKVAEKYNSLIHGFGMTRTSILPQLPFYTVDSTSWKSGFMYGQLAFWNGKKVQMVGKEGFEKAFKYIGMYDLNPPIDEKLIYDYYEPEVLRANVFAYQLAEEFIINSLKPLMYWQKPKSNKRTEENLKNIEYPTPEWLATPKEKKQNVEKYARNFNISMEDPDEAMNLVIDMTCFMNWDNPDYLEYINECYTPEMLKEIHDVYINRIVESDEERVEDLKAFYKANLLGEDTTLLYLGTNFDRIVKEREDNEYITDEEYEYEDVSDIEINNTLAKLLPEKTQGDAPEIDELDDEIFREQGIEPVRDKNGHFLKGQRKVLKPKKLYSEKYPKLACDVCVNAQRCPQYKAGYVCAFNKMFQRYNTRDMADVIQAMQGIVDFSMQRLQRGMMTEMLNGGIPDPAVSQMMNQSMGLLNQLQRMYECGSQAVIKQTKVVRADGTQETTTQVSNPQSGGILAQIFGSMSNDGEPKEEVIDVTPKEEETEK